MRTLQIVHERERFGIVELPAIHGVNGLAVLEHDYRGFTVVADTIGPCTGQIYVTQPQQHGIVVVRGAHGGAIMAHRDAVEPNELPQL